MAATMVYTAILEEQGLKPFQLEKRLSLSVGAVRNAIKRNSSISLETAHKIKEAFPTYSLDWITTGTGNKYDTVIEKAHENARDLGSAGSETAINRNNHFQKLGKDKYLMFTKLVNRKAQAGYLAGWGDEEYVSHLPTHAIIVNELHKGTYRSFEITGDSADDGTKHSICDGDIVTGRQLSRGHWRNKLHSNQYPYWIIVHRVEGILCKMITEHDTEQGTILCVSRNPDKKKYPDLLLSLDDVSEIYNVVQVTVNGKNL